MSVVKFIIEIILGLCAIASIILAIWSMKISREANQTARDAISVSQLQFIEENRPYIEITPKKFENGLYLEFVEHEKDCEINLMYKIVNVGKGIATDVLVPQHAKLSDEMLKKGNSLGENIPTPPPKISLAPGEDITMILRQVIKPNNVTVEEYLKDYRDGKNFLGYDFQVIYRSEINEKEIYSTKATYNIYKDRAILESYRHTRISDPADVKIYNDLFNRIPEK